MNRIWLLVGLIMLPAWLCAQQTMQDIQVLWLNDKAGEDHFWDNYKGYIYSEKEGLLSDIPIIDSDRSGGTYRETEAFEHDQRRILTLGKVTSVKKPFYLISAWRKKDAVWMKEMDLAIDVSEYEAVSEPLLEILRSERREWVEYANRHNPAEHIKVSYTNEAVYLSGGTESRGQDGIASRYSYMENPNYQVDLEPRHTRRVGDDSVLEVGRYFTGSVKRGNGGVYLILWQRQECNEWKIGFDFNF